MLILTQRVTKKEGHFGFNLVCDEIKSEGNKLH